jgi:hypothetical protein
MLRLDRFAEEMKPGAYSALASTLAKGIWNLSTEFASLALLKPK